MKTVNELFNEIFGSKNSDLQTEIDINNAKRARHISRSMTGDSKRHATKTINAIGRQRWQQSRELDHAN